MNGCISLITFNTYTNHRSHWCRIKYFALGIYTARLRCITWIYTCAVDASRLRWAIAVVATNWFILHTDAVLELCTRQAATLWLMVICSAQFVWLTRLTFAWIFAAIINARFIRWAFSVRLTTDHITNHLRVAVEARQTFADGIMIDAKAFGSLSACIGRTSRHTLSIDARMCG